MKTYIIETGGWLEDFCTESSLKAAKKAQNRVQQLEDEQAGNDSPSDTVHIYRVERIA